MTWWDKVKSIFTPSSRYDGQSRSRRTRDWYAPRTAPDPVGSLSLQEIRDKSRAIARHDVGSRALAVLSSLIVGGGILPSSEDEDFDELLDDFARPQRQVGANKGQSLLTVQRLVARGVIEGGSVLAIRRWRTRAQMQQRNLALPFQVQILEPEWLDCSYDTRFRRDSDEYVFNGIRVDDTGWPTAYRIFTEDPRLSLTTESEWVDAGDVSHVMWQLRAGQMIGIPWFAPILLKIYDIDGYEDAQLLRQKMAAMFMAFVTSDNPDTVGTDEVSLEPGRIQTLRPGEQIVFPELPSSGGEEEFVRSRKRAIAACVGLSYEELSNDYSQVNFSSARMSALVTNTLREQWQREMMIGQFCQDLDRWIGEGADMIGIRPQPIDWTPPGRPLIDPSREVGAMGRKIEFGLSSREAEVRAMGRDVEDVDAERARDRARSERLGLSDDNSGNQAQASAKQWAF